MKRIRHKNTLRLTRRRLQLHKVSSHINAQIVETRRFISNDISYGFDYSFGGIIKFYRSKEMYAFPYADTRFPLTFHPYFRPISILYFPCTAVTAYYTVAGVGITSYQCVCFDTNKFVKNLFRREFNVDLMRLPFSDKSIGENRNQWTL